MATGTRANGEVVVLQEVGRCGWLQEGLAPGRPRRSLPGEPLYDRLYFENAILGLLYFMSYYW